MKLRSRKIISLVLAIFLAGQLLWILSPCHPSRGSALITEPQIAQTGREIALSDSGSDRTPYAALSKNVEPRGIERSKLPGHLQLAVLNNITDIGIPYANVRVLPELEDRMRMLPVGALTEVYGMYYNGNAIMSYVADAYGNLLIKRPSRPALLVCKSGTAYGYLRIYPDCLTEELRVFQSESPQARVWRDGKPLEGKEMALYYKDASGGSVKLAVKASDGDGRVDFEDYSIYASQLGYGSWLSMGFDGVFSANNIKKIQDPSQTIDVDYPATVRIAITVSSEIATPEEYCVTISHGGYREATEDFSVSRLTQAGSVTFDNIGVDLPLIVRAKGTLSGASGETRCQSPFLSGAAQDVVVRIATLPTRMTGWLRPISGDLQVEVTEGRKNGGEEYRQRLSVASDGRFEMYLPEEFASIPSVVVNVYSPDGCYSAAVADVYRNSDNTFELGCIELKLSGRAVIGRVETSEGEPVEGARVYHLGGDSGLIMTDGEGRFSFCCNEHTLECQVAVQHDLYVPLKSVRIVLEGRESIVVLEQGGQVRGSLLVDPIWLCDRLRIQMKLEGTETWRTQLVDRPGIFCVKSLSAGGYLLRIVADDRPDDYIEIDNVIVRPGSETRDRRLDGIDVRALMRPVVMEIIDSSGNPVTAGSLWSRISSRSQWAGPTYFQDSAVLLASFSDDLELFVDGWGKGAKVHSLRWGSVVSLDVNAAKACVLMEPAGLKAPGSVQIVSVKVRYDDDRLPPLSVDAAPGLEGWFFAAPYPGRINVIIDYKFAHGYAGMAGQVIVPVQIKEQFLPYPLIIEWRLP